LSLIVHKTATSQDINQWKQKSGLAPDPYLSDTNKSNASSSDEVEMKKQVDVGKECIRKPTSNTEQEQQQQQQITDQLATPEHDLEHDQQQHHQQQQSTLICPICIHEIQKGDDVCYSGFCHHVFHRDCLSAWLSTHSRICPYCRGEIITQEMLAEAHQTRLAQQTTAEWDDDDDDYDEHHSDSGDDDDDDEISVGAFSRYRP
jgi:Ring finger domain